jgi:mRNA degradation ribonuclease J1/J2
MPGIDYIIPDVSYLAGNEKNIRGVLITHGHYDHIGAIPGVLSVQDQMVTNGAGRYVVEAARGRDVRAEIFQLAAQQRWSLLELKRVGMTLEEVFIRIVAGEETDEEARA